MMSATIEQRLSELGIELPNASAPAANYIPYTMSDDLLFVSGQIPMGPNGPEHVGKLGETMDVAGGQAAARLCGLNIIAQAKAALGDLDRVLQVMKLQGFVNATHEFTQHPEVVNGASDLMVEVFGDKGRHARAAVGMGSLPRGVSVEVDAIIRFA